jgi:hypothetical protein
MAATGEKKQTNSGCIPSLVNNKYHQFIKGNVEKKKLVPHVFPNMFPIPPPFNQYALP